MDCQQFTLFPFLPTEIRLEIWRMAAMVPQTISLKCKTPTTTSDTPQWSSFSPMPSIFSVSSEARSVALSIYTLLSFSYELVKPPSRPLYINFSTDTISLARGVHSRYARNLLQENPQVRDRLRRIILQVVTWQELNTRSPVPGPIIDSRWDCMGYSMDVFPVTVGESLRSLEEVRFHDERITED